ncbi:MAG: DUF4783 domain-containing protein [Bacteroidetes bacterium]|nr:DUF4783 domain-containing protein [Bacteroidota bacterium]
MAPPIFIALSALVVSIFPGMRTDSDKLLNLFGAGKTKEIAAYFNPSVQLTTPGKEGVYSRSQARMILADFFSENTPADCKLQNQGNSDNGAHFLIMNLKTSQQDFKVSLFYRGSGQSIRIHELKIEK